MNESGKSKRIAIDFGASRVKVSSFSKNKEFDNFWIPNCVRIGDSSLGSGYVVRRDNQCKRMGANNGIPNMQPMKINYQHLEDFILAIAYEVREKYKWGNEEIQLRIDTLLPPTQFFTTGQLFKKKILDFETLKGTVNNSPIQCKIIDVKVKCEGASILNVLDISQLSINIRKILLIDVGSSTIELIEVLKDNNEWEVADVTTIDFGGTRMCKSIANGLTTRYGTLFEYKELEKTMNYTYKMKEHSILNEAAYLDEIAEEFKTYMLQFKDPRQYKVVLAGDGSPLLYSNKKIKAFLQEATILPQVLLTYGNSMGALV